MIISLMWYSNISISSEVKEDLWPFLKTKFPNFHFLLDNTTLKKGIKLVMAFKAFSTNLLILICIQSGPVVLLLSNFTMYDL